MRTKKDYMTPEEYNRIRAILHRNFEIAIEKARANPNPENIEAFFEARKALEDSVLEAPPLY